MTYFKHTLKGIEEPFPLLKKKKIQNHENVVYSQTN
jgi:hypothetical protein